jgi:type IV pilus assembly protein PilA
MFLPTQTNRRSRREIKKMRPTADSAYDRVVRTNAIADRGFSLIELLVVVAIILIIAAIAIPDMLRSKISANQAAAVSNLRAITTASVSYSLTYNNGYPPSLGALGGAGAAAATCAGAELVDETLTIAPYQKSGYQFAYTGEEGNVALPAPGCTAGFTGYLVTAVPITPGITGNLSFCSSEPGVIEFDPLGQTPASEAACQALQPLQ